MSSAPEPARPGRGFGSDNHAGVHPEILAAVAAANRGHAGAYGADQEFFAFLRSLDAYRRSLTGDNATLMIEPDSAFFDYLHSPNRRVPAVPAAPAEAEPKKP